MLSAQAHISGSSVTLLDGRLEYSSFSGLEDGKSKTGTARSKPRMGSDLDSSRWYYDTRTVVPRVLD